MRCYYHPEIQAVGICKNCQKGLCADSASDVGDGLACRDACEEMVRALNAKLAASKPWTWAVAGLAFGLIFLLGAAVLWYENGFSSGWFPAALGVIFVGAGVWNLLAPRAAPRRA